MEHSRTPGREDDAAGAQPPGSACFVSSLRPPWPFPPPGRAESPYRCPPQSVHTRVQRPRCRKRLFGFSTVSSRVHRPRRHRWLMPPPAPPAAKCVSVQVISNLLVSSVQSDAQDERFHGPLAQSSLNSAARNIGRISCQGVRIPCSSCGPRRGDGSTLRDEGRREPSQSHEWATRIDGACRSPRWRGR